MRDPHFRIDESFKSVRYLTVYQPVGPDLGNTARRGLGPGGLEIKDHKFCRRQLAIFKPVKAKLDHISVETEPRVPFDKVGHQQPGQIWVRPAYLHYKIDDAHGRRPAAERT